MHDFQRLASEYLINNGREGVAHIIDGQCHRDYPERSGKILSRLGRSCAVAEVGTSPHSNYFTNGELRNTEWGEKCIITCGFVDETPELPANRKYLKLNNLLGKPFVISWEDA